MNEDKKQPKAKEKPQKPQRPPVPPYTIGDIVVVLTNFGASQCKVDSADYSMETKTWNYTLRLGSSGNKFNVPGGQGILYKANK